MKRKTIFNTLILTLMVFSSLFVANLSPHIKVSAESIPVTLVSGNKYRDGKGNYYEKAIAGVSAYSTNTLYAMPSTKAVPTRGETLFFKYESIVWQVLDYDSTNNRALVVSNKILANMNFQPTYYSTKVDSTTYYYTTANGGIAGTTKANDYAYSNIRYWLNGYTQTGQVMATDGCLIGSLNYGDSFYDSAFTTSEQNKILATSLTTNGDRTDATTYVTGTFNQSSPTSADKLFLLSAADAINANYYESSTSSSKTRYKQVTDYSASQGAYVWTYTTDEMYTGNWWTRSPFSSTDTMMAEIVMGGFASLSGYQVYLYVYNGIAPAMYLNTTGLTFYTTADCTTTTTAAAKTYIKFGSYPQSVADCTTTINIPEAGVSINTMGIIFSSIILIGLLIWAGTIGIKSLNKKKKI